MSSFAFRSYLGFLGAMILFSLSPFAFLGGLVVTALLFVPFSLLLAGIGVEVSGQTIDDLIATAFFIGCVFCGLVALWQFYRAAEFAENGQPMKRRFSVSIGATLLVLPVVIYFCFKALPGI